jgi:hypothetical protein
MDYMRTFKPSSLNMFWDITNDLKGGSVLIYVAMSLKDSSLSYIFVKSTVWILVYSMNFKAGKRSFTPVFAKFNYF